jgi:epoxyqueuosine reductase
LITKRLKKLRNFIIEKCENSSKKDFKLCVDTGPVLEKLIAMSAGMGFIGKNSLLITPEFGSWIFLSEIFTTIKLETDEERKELGECGTCEKCMTTCPTKALIKPCTLDPGKCISYLSIEHKDKISSDLYKKFNGWIYGCDICQEVCPHNKGKSKLTNEKTFTEHISGPYITREKLQKMTEEEFEKTFAGSPLKRAGLSKLKSLDKHIKVP